MTGEIDGVMKRLGNLTGVLGTMIMNSNGLPIRTTFRDAEAVHYAALISEFLRKSKLVLEPLMGTQPIDVIRIRSHKTELIITPDTKSDIILVVVQDATAEA